jgi:hypothetical protein
LTCARRRAEPQRADGRGRITDHVLRLVGQPAGDDVQPVGGGREQQPA